MINKTTLTQQKELVKTAKAQKESKKYLSNQISNMSEQIKFTEKQVTTLEKIAEINALASEISGYSAMLPVDSGKFNMDIQSYINSLNKFIENEWHWKQ